MKNGIFRMHILIVFGYFTYFFVGTSFIEVINNKRKLTHMR